MNGAADEHLRAPHDIWLAFRERVVEAMGNEILGGSERGVFAVDDGKRQLWSRRARFLNQQRVRHPKPEAVNLDRVIRRQSYRQPAAFFGVERRTLPRLEIPALDLQPARSAA